MTIGLCDGCRTRGVLLNSWRPRSRELGSGFFFETLLAVIASVERDNRKIPRQLRSRLNAAPASLGTRHYRLSCKSPAMLAMSSRASMGLDRCM